VWLSEGFASYFTHLYNEFTYGHDRRASDMDEDRKWVIKYSQKYKLPVVFASLPQNLMELLNINSYQKGSWVLHMLRREIGNENFWKGIRLYYKRYQNSNADTAAFIAIMEEVSDQKLNQFFDQWLYKTGQPLIDGKWQYNKSTKSLSITIEQIQKDQAFNFPLEIGVYLHNKPMHIESVRVDSRSKIFSFTVESEPEKIILDPNVNLLFDGKLRN
jgi:aminopeptidase N